ncbi:MAG: DNA cytosine methyltransferase [Deltaproteobacteria bacterium]|nr:DNA cytosine methyltransferase [Deltaproteobacteria bacterium]
MAFTFIDLFAGIGGFHLAASSLGGRCVFASEIDQCARKVYEANFGFEPAGDITKIDADDIPDHEALFAGFPCQPFSIIGSQLGFDDIRGTLFFDIARILKSKKPKFFILENVKRICGHNNGQTMRVILDTLQSIGYSNLYWRILNALDFGLPQKRERTIIVGFLSRAARFEFPTGRKMAPLAKILEPEESVGKKYFASERIAAKRRATHKSSYKLSLWHENKNGNIASYPYSCALRANASYNYLLVNGQRRLTERELLRLQGFPDSFKFINNYNQTRKQTGNAVPVNMIRSVLEVALKSWAKAEIIAAKARDLVI